MQPLKVTHAPGARRGRSAGRWQVVDQPFMITSDIRQLRLRHGARRRSADWRITPPHGAQPFGYAELLLQRHNLLARRFRTRRDALKALTVALLEDQGRLPA